MKVGTRRWTTPAGIEVIRTTEPVDEADALATLESIPDHPPRLSSSAYEGALRRPEHAAARPGGDQR